MSPARLQHRGRWLAILLTILALVAPAACGKAQKADINQPRTFGGTSTILYTDGSVLGHMPAQWSDLDEPATNRFVLADNAIPLAFEDAIVSLEDHTFWTNNGVNFKSVIRAARDHLFNGGGGGGASTLTMQLAKILYFKPDGSPMYKLQQSDFARMLNSRYSKQQIMALYANSVYYCNNMRGIEAAAQGLFGHSAAKLTLAEAATLAAMVQAPCNYMNHKETAADLKDRRNLALDQMRNVVQQDGSRSWSDKQLNRAKQQSLKFNRHPATYTVANSSEPFIADLTNLFIKGLNDKKVDAAVKDHGVDIRTSFDSGVQSRLNQAVADHRISSRLAIGATVLNQQTSGLAGMYGGSKDAYRGSNHARKDQNNYALAMRRGGSTSKILTLAALAKYDVAFNSRVHCSARFQTSDKHIWTNSEGDANGDLSIVEATQRSVNTCFLALITGYSNDGSYKNRTEVNGDPISPDKTWDVAKDLGAKTVLVPGSKVKDPFIGPSLTLGAGPQNTVQRAGELTRIANHGESDDPWFVESIQDKVTHETLYRHSDHTHVNRALDPGSADNVMGALGTVTQPGGTAAGLGLGRPSATKTGTDEDVAAFIQADGTYFACSVATFYPNSNKRLVINGHRVYGRDIGPVCSQTLKRSLVGKPAGAFAPEADFNRGTIIGN